MSFEARSSVLFLFDAGSSVSGMYYLSCFRLDSRTCCIMTQLKVSLWGNWKDKATLAKVEPELVGRTCGRAGERVRKIEILGVDWISGSSWNMKETLDFSAYWQYMAIWSAPKYRIPEKVEEVLKMEGHKHMPHPNDIEMTSSPRPEGVYRQQFGWKSRAMVPNSHRILTVVHACLHNIAQLIWSCWMNCPFEGCFLFSFSVTGWFERIWLYIYISQWLQRQQISPTFAFVMHIADTGHLNSNVPQNP